MDPLDPTRDHFVTAYDTAPPWDIGRPQRDVVTALDELASTGRALDVGCGTAEHVLELARRGIDAWGVDSTDKALVLGRAKAAERGLTVHLVQGDALDLVGLKTRFDLVLDCGLFHVVRDDERAAYAAQIAQVLNAGGHFLMLGFQTNDSGFGPRGYSQQQLRDFLTSDFEEVWVRPADWEVNDRAPMPAWLSLFRRR